MPDPTDPAAWSIEQPFDFGDVLDREPPTYAATSTDDETDEAPDPS